jgi:chromatin assembly factor 1 subunit B
VWQQQQNAVLPEDSMDKELWSVVHHVSGFTDVYDITWAPNSSALGLCSTDCSVAVFQLSNARLQRLTSHEHFVQGVSWDPRNEFLASASADRSCWLHRLTALGHAKLGSSCFAGDTLVRTYVPSPWNFYAQ